MMMMMMMCACVATAQYFACFPTPPPFYSTVTLNVPSSEAVYNGPSSAKTASLTLSRCVTEFDQGIVSGK